MSVTVEKLDNSMAKLTIEVDAAVFTKALDKVYNKQKNQIQVPGFRRGKAPRKIVEKMYGQGIFYEDAVNDCINATYEDAVKECGEEVTSSPEIGAEQIEEGKPLIYTATVALRPPVTLGKYLGVDITIQDPLEVTEEEINAELKRQQDANARIETVTDRPVQDGDMIKLDFAGTVDGEPFDGGTAADYDLTVGSGSFIPGFEDQLIGMELEEEKDVVVTFPENYGEESLAGKEAVFHCMINEIKAKTLPELNDEFADEVSEFSTLEEYTENLKQNLLDQKEKELREKKQNEAVAAAVNAAEIDIPDAMILTQARNLADQFAQNLQYQYGNGLDMDTYLQYMGMTQEQFVDNMKPQAEQRIRNSLVLEAVAAAEGIEVTDEDFEAEYQSLADQYNMPLDNVKNIFAGEGMKEDLKKDILSRKAADLITDNALETIDPDAKEEAEAEEAEEVEETVPEEDSAEE